MIQRFFNARRFDADKGGIAGAAGQSDEAAKTVSAGEENTGGDDAFLNALGFDEKTRAALAPKREKQQSPSSRKHRRQRSRLRKMMTKLRCRPMPATRRC